MSGPAVPASRAAILPLVGGALALDFCNTASGRGTAEAIEHLLAPGDVVDWCRRAGVVDAGEAGWLAALCAEPGFGPGLLRRATALRAAVHGVLAALAAGEAPRGADLDAVAASHAACLAAGRLAAKGDGFGWAWSAREAPEAALLGPVAASAVAIVLEADRARLKRCPGHACGWLFLDRTKSNNRRWCEMEVCGNRAKQRRRRARPAGP